MHWAVFSNNEPFPAHASDLTVYLDWDRGMETPKMPISLPPLELQRCSFPFENQGIGNNVQVDCMPHTTFLCCGHILDSSPWCQACPHSVHYLSYTVPCLPCCHCWCMTKLSPQFFEQTAQVKCSEQEWPTVKPCCSIVRESIAFECLPARTVLLPKPLDTLKQLASGSVVHDWDGNRIFLIAVFLKFIPILSLFN